MSQAIHAHPVILVTGASRGLGAAIARQAARLGAAVVLAARSQDLLERIAGQINQAGGAALALRADISREVDCRAIIQQAGDHFGRIDALVNNSGRIEPIAPLAEASLRQWKQNLAVNLLGAVTLTHLAIPHLRQHRGRVINISSGAAEMVIPGWTAYSAAKAALNHLTRILAGEEPGLTALAVSPGTMDTAMQGVIRKKGKGRMAEANYYQLAGLHMQGRLLPPDVPGLAIACLALHAPHEWSGETMRYNEPRIVELVGLFAPGDEAN